MLRSHTRVEKNSYFYFINKNRLKNCLERFSENRESTTSSSLQTAVGI